jgi:thiamine biosynthesis lipoprotein
VSTASASFSALGTTAVVVVAEAAALARARSLLEHELEQIDVACSRFRPDSELAIANAAGGREVAVSRLFAHALQVGLDAARDTGGLVDPTLGAQLRAAGYDRTFALVRVRDSWQIVPRSHPVDTWREVELDVERGLVRVPPGVELDLGATAKALAADRAAQAIAEETGTGTLVSLGGDLAVSGEPPLGGWCVRIADDHRTAPDSTLPGSSGPRVLVATGGLATSSTTVRSWQTDRGPAHHLLDPASGLPADGPWRTVSVAANSCVEANVASTAAIILGHDASAWLALRGLPARLAGRDGSVSYVAGWPADTEAEAA